MICISKELIDRELEKDREDGFEFSYKKLSNKFLDWLFRHYYCVEQCVNSYDSEPFEYDEWKELRKTSEGRSKIAQAYRDYEPQRIRFNNWQDAFSKGLWGMTQEIVDKGAKESLKMARNIPACKNDRIYFAEQGDQIRIFLYTRDIEQIDERFIFNKR